MKRFAALLLAFTLLLTGCAPKSQSQTSVDLMTDITPIGMATGEEGVPIAAVTDFSVRLLQSGMVEGENTLLSPLSVLYALSMTANGANGNTLAQMEAVLGESVGQLNGWLGTYDTGENIALANGIWIKDDPAFTVNQDFLQTNANYYGAGIYKAPFDDSTVQDINGFVEEKTDGMVKAILDEIPDEAVMYLVNALSFEAGWMENYEAYQLNRRAFTKEDGTEQNAELMYSEEEWYIEDENATGFIKYYEDYRYAFVALLPREGLPVAEYVQGLTGEAVQSILANRRMVPVQAAIPKFESAHSAPMNETLKSMGMSDAFDEKVADFSRMGSHAEGNIFISNVIHKAFISVAEKGTKAGAATSVEMAAPTAAAPQEREEKTVILDRPFLYMIVDMSTNLPVFIGTLMDMGEEAFLLVEPNESGHAHVPAEEPEVCSYPTVGYCGNIITTVKLGDEEYSFMYDDSVMLTDILTNQLTYSPDAVCRCIADITVETELGGPYYVNLQESFARCAEGQAALTQTQSQTIREIIEGLE